MCGTFTQIAGMAFGLYFTDMVITPVVRGRGELGDIMMFLVKGAVQYWVYKWFQCTSTGTYSRHVMANVSFMQLLVGGLIGGVTLFFAGQLVNERTAGDFTSILVKYGLEAVILNFVYGATKNMITTASAAAAGGSSSGSGSTSTSGA